MYLILILFTLISYCSFFFCGVSLMHLYFGNGFKLYENYLKRIPFLFLPEHIIFSMNLTISGLVN